MTIPSGHYQAEQHPNPAAASTSMVVLPSVNGRDQEPPRKRTRCLRSCLACRRAKQRCQLPDSFVEPSESALPPPLSCKRCQLMELDCYVVDSVPRPSSNRSRRAARASEPMASSHAAQEIERAPSQSRVSGLEQLPLSSNVMIQQQQHSRSRSDPRTLTGRQSNERSNSESGSTPPPMNDLRIFEPETTAESEDTSETSRVQGRYAATVPSPSSKAKRNRDWMKVGRTVCRPFELLGYLLKRQPIAQRNMTHTQTSSVQLRELIASVADVRARYEAELDVLQQSMPFFPTFTELWQAGGDADLLLGTVLYISYKIRQEVQAEAQILPALRQHCLSCVLHSPRNMYDIVSLILTALHLPLLLGTLSDGNCLEGVGLLTSASSASRSLELDRSFSALAMQMPSTLDFSGEARKASLWTSLCLYSGFVALAGDVDRQPFVRCSREDLEVLQSYSDAVSSASTASLSTRRQCASVSLLIFRTRATTEIREITQKYASLMMVHQDNLDRSANLAGLQSLINESKNVLQSCCDGLKQLKYPLAKKLASYGWQKPFCMDVLGLDLALLQFMCFSRYAEKLFERSPMLIGANASPADLLSILHADLPLQHLYTTIGCHRADIGRHVLSLFINTVRHASAHSLLKAGMATPLNLLYSIPPTHLCSSLVMAAQAVTEELDGRIADGKSPSKSIGDAALEVGEILLHGTSQALMQLGDMVGASDAQIKEASHQGNLFVLSARLTDSLTRRVMAWKSVVEHGNDSAQTTPTSAPANGDVERSTQFQMNGFSPDSFEDLFREILATPIEFL